MCGTFIVVPRTVKSGGAFLCSVIARRRHDDEAISYGAVNYSSLFISSSRYPFQSGTNLRWLSHWACRSASPCFPFLSGSPSAGENNQHLSSVRNVRLVAQWIFWDEFRRNDRYVLPRWGSEKLMCVSTDISPLRVWRISKSIFENWISSII